MLRRRAAAALLVSIALLAGPMAHEAWAHAALTRADPPPGATLTTAPTVIRLTFSERPEASLSDIRVLDSGGAAFQGGSPVAAGTGQLSLVVPVRSLGRGTYHVDWRVVSADDAHATSGAYAFGVGATPAGSVTATTTTTAASSWFEGVARWVFLIGLVALLGASVAAVARFGGRTGSDLTLAVGGWGASVVGLALLAEAQRRTAGSSFAVLLDTSAGTALIWRAFALVTAGAALLIAWRRDRIRRGAMFVAALAALAAIVAHVGEGHAAAGPWPTALTISAQVAHVAAAGVWFGGLAALLLGVRGEPSDAKAAAVRRFAMVAAGALVVLVVTGTVRAVDELSSVGQLVSSGYGRAVLAKIALIAIIAGLAARNRRHVSSAAEELRPLRRGSSAELALAAVALAIAALLGTLAPPAPAEPSAEADLAAPKNFVSVERPPGGPPKYTMQIGSIGYIRIVPDPERAGPSKVYVTCYTAFSDISLVKELALTAAAADGPTRRLPVRRLSSGRFVAPVNLGAGPNMIVVTARTDDGTRLRGEFKIQVPSG